MYQNELDTCLDQYFDMMRKIGSIVTYNDILPFKEFVSEDAFLLATLKINDFDDSNGHFPWINEALTNC